MAPFGVPRKAPGKPKLFELICKRAEIWSRPKVSTDSFWIPLQCFKGYQGLQHKSPTPKRRKGSCLRLGTRAGSVLETMVMRGARLRFCSRVAVFGNGSLTKRLKSLKQSLPGWIQVLRQGLVKSVGIAEPLENTVFPEKFQQDEQLLIGGVTDLVQQMFTWSFETGGSTRKVSPSECWSSYVGAGQYAETRGVSDIPKVMIFRAHTTLSLGRDIRSPC